MFKEKLIDFNGMSIGLGLFYAWKLLIDKLIDFNSMSTSLGLVDVQSL